MQHRLASMNFVTKRSYLRKVALYSGNPLDFSYGKGTLILYTICPNIDQNQSHPRRTNRHIFYHAVLFTKERISKRG